MNPHTLAQGEPWMTPEERTLNQDFVQSTTRLLATRGVPPSPLIMLRISDVIATWLLARRLEAALIPKPGEPAPCPTPAQAGAIGKCRDRLRRAMKDLEACCQSIATPIETDLEELLHQLAHQHVRPEFSEEAAGETSSTEASGSEQPRNPAPAEPSPNRATRRRQAREKHRKKRGMQSMERRRPAGSVAKPPTRPTENIPRSIQVSRDFNPEQQPGEG